MEKHVSKLATTTKEDEKENKKRTEELKEQEELNRISEMGTILFIFIISMLILLISYIFK